MKKDKNKKTPRYKYIVVHGKVISVKLESPNRRLILKAAKAAKS